MREAALLLLCIAFGLGVHLGLHLHDAPAPHTHEFATDARGEAWAPRRTAAAVDVPAPPPPPPLPPPPPKEADLYASLVAAPEPPPPPAAAAGPMEAWAAAGRRFPVVMLAATRDAELRNALTSLISTAGAADVCVAQDGDAQAVADVVAEFAGVRRKSRPRPPQEPKVDGASRIARHYRFSLDWALAECFPDAPAVVVVEDDLLFAPDFLDYFGAVAPALERDESLFVASAWNDNGFLEDGDKAALRRTSWFPGLGWLLPRALWERELRPKWPKTHWDHWMRDKKTHRGRETAYPEVPRSFHAGVKGTFMDSWHDGRYFAPIRMNGEPFAWPAGAHAQVLRDAYEQRLADALNDADHVADLDEFRRRAEEDIWRPLVLWYGWTSRSAYDFEPPPFVCVSEVLHIWHEAVRAAHHGLHEHRLGRRKVFLVNAKESKYRTFKPGALAPLTQRGCPAVTWQDLGKEE